MGPSQGKDGGQILVQEVFLRLSLLWSEAAQRGAELRADRSEPGSNNKLGCVQRRPPLLKPHSMTDEGTADVTTRLSDNTL